MSFIHGNIPLAQRIRFAAGQLHARTRLRRYGAGLRIDASVQLIEPAKIAVGNGVEILRRTTLDGRSQAQIGIRIGDSCRIKENVWLACYGGTIDLGNEVFVGRNVVLQGHGGIEVGAFSGLGPNVVIVSHRQVMQSDQRYHDQGFVPQRVVIEGDVYIGAGTVVMAGVRIGTRTQIGANSVVLHDLEGGYVYAGAPARRVGKSTRPAPTGPIRFHADWSGGARR